MEAMMQSMEVEEMVDPRWGVNELLVRHPASAAVLNAFGVDTCCGGASSLAAGADDAGIALDELLRALAIQLRTGRGA